MIWHASCFIFYMIYPAMLQIGSSYNIIYTNADGLSSERDITVNVRWTNYGHDYIQAYCWNRNENRTFRIERIESAGKLIELEKATEQPWPVIPAPSKPAEPEPVVAYKRPAGGHPVLVTLSTLFVILALWAGFDDDSARSTYKQTAKAVTRPSKTVKALPHKTAQWEQSILVRKDRYKISTGFRDPRLLDLYASADSDYNNILSWQEIDNFQHKINRMFSYITNSTALDPIEFMANGGGDCEDWSIFTCGMLRFWGYTAYVGMVDGGSGGGLHAIALFYKKTPPANQSYSYYQLDEAHYFYNLTLPAGCYLPIDYNHTGSFSNASRPESPLHNVYRPEEIYGSYM